jgi:hypothetical protein
MRVETEQPRYPGFARERVDAETKRPTTTNVASVVANVPDGLNWQSFTAACFPGRRRHDLEALTAYGAYRRSHAVDERSSEEGGPMDEARSRPAGSTAVQDWEDEGGATLSGSAGNALGLATPDPGGMIRSTRGERLPLLAGGH